jgi:hypothetical protein
MCSDLACRAEKLVDVALAITDMDASSWITQKFRGLLQIFQPSDAFLFLVSSLVPPASKPSEGAEKSSHGTAASSAANADRFRFSTSTETDCVAGVGAATLFEIHVKIQIFTSI